MMPAAIRFLAMDDVLRLHQIAIIDQGGDPTIRDRSLLESAVATPQQEFGGEYLHDGIPAMAAAYAIHICKNHAFVDGNKRAAAAAMIAFLSDNGWRFDAPVDDAVAGILSLAAGEMDKHAFTNWARQYMHEKPRLDLREFFARLDYKLLGSTFGAIAAGPADERAATIMEAGTDIPAIHVANIGASSAEAEGDEASATILRQHAMLLTAIHRIAEDMGYEW